MMKLLWYPPALTERLTRINTDDSGEVYSPLTAEKMRQLVINELLELFNHTNIEPVLEGEGYRQLAASAINYGIPRRLAYDSEQQWPSIGEDIHTAILRFEPRIIPETLTVRVLTTSDPQGKYGVISFAISALIEWLPQPVDLFIHGHYDKGNDTFSIG